VEQKEKNGVSWRGDKLGTERTSTNITIRRIKGTFNDRWEKGGLPEGKATLGKYSVTIRAKE